MLSVMRGTAALATVLVVLASLAAQGVAGDRHARFLAVTPSPSVSPSPSPAATPSVTPTPSPFSCPGEVFEALYATDAAAAAAAGSAAAVEAVTSAQAGRSFLGVVDDARCLADREASMISLASLAARDPGYGYHSDGEAAWRQRAPSDAGLAPGQAWRRVDVCSGHGTCSRQTGSTSGGGACACAWGFTGASCSTCAPGMHMKRVCATCSITLSSQVAGSLAQAVAGAAGGNTTVGNVWGAWLQAVKFPNGTIVLNDTCAEGSVFSCPAPAPSNATGCSVETLALREVACSLPHPDLAAAAPWWWHGAGRAATGYGATGSVAGNGACTAQDGSGICAASVVDAVTGAVSCPAGFQQCAGDSLGARGTAVHAVDACVPCSGARLVSVVEDAGSATQATAAEAFAGTTCSGHGMCLPASAGVWPPTDPATLTSGQGLGGHAAAAAALQGWTVSEAGLFAAAERLGNLTDPTTAKALLQSAAADFFTGSQQPGPVAGQQAWTALAGATARGAVQDLPSMHTSRGTTSMLREVVAPLNLTWVLPFLASPAIVGGGACACAPGWAGPDCGVHIASGSQVAASGAMAAGANGQAALNATESGAVDGFPPLAVLAVCSGDPSCSGHGACTHSKAYQQYRLFGTLPAKQGELGIETAFDTFLNPDRSDMWPSTLAKCQCVAGWGGDRCHLPLTSATRSDFALALPQGATPLTGQRLDVPMWTVADAWSACSTACNGGVQVRPVQCNVRNAAGRRPGQVCEAVLYDGPTRRSDGTGSFTPATDPESYSSALEAGVPTQLFSPWSGVNGSCSALTRPSVSRSCRTVACGTSLSTLTLPVSSYSQAVVDAVLARAATLTGSSVDTTTARYGAEYPFHRVTGGAGAFVAAGVHVGDDGAVGEAWVTSLAVDVAVAASISVQRVRVNAAGNRLAATGAVAVAGAASCGGLGRAATCAQGVDVQLEIASPGSSAVGEAAAPAAVQELVNGAKSASSAVRVGVEAVYAAAQAVASRQAATSTTSLRRRAQAAASQVDAAGVPRIMLVASTVDTAAVADASFTGSTEVTQDVAGASNTPETGLSLWEIIGICIGVLVFILVFGCGMYYCWLCSVRSDPKYRRKRAIMARRAAVAKRAAETRATKQVDSDSHEAHDEAEAVPLAKAERGGALPPRSRAGGLERGRLGRRGGIGVRSATSSGDSPVIHDAMGDSVDGSLSVDSRPLPGEPPQVGGSPKGGSGWGGPSSDVGFKVERKGTPPPPSSVLATPQGPPGGGEGDELLGPVRRAESPPPSAAQDSGRVAEQRRRLSSDEAEPLLSVATRGEEAEPRHGRMASEASLDMALSPSPALGRSGYRSFGSEGKGGSGEELLGEQALGSEAVREMFQERGEGQGDGDSDSSDGP